jgi:hypothetical protein
VDGRRLGKLAAPVIITGLLVAYLVYNIMQAASFPGLLKAQPLLFIVPVLLIGVSVYVLMQRIREIQSGEEDDLHKY